MEEVKKQGMESLFVPYEIALALKELGFDEPCFGNYNNLTETTRFIFGKTNEGCLVYNKVPGTDIIVTSNERILAPLYQQAFRWLYKQLGRDGFGVMPIDTDKCNEELRKLIEIVKEITPHNHE
jgi:hypothetical protein